MGTINLVAPVAATPAVAGVFSTAFTTIQTAINGNLDNTNINAAAAIDPLKLASGWAAYTPVWATSGTAVSLGNGTITGRYTQIGKTVFARIVLTMGSTTTYGTGAYTLSLPVTAQAGVPNMCIGQIFVQDASPVNSYMEAAICNTTTTINLVSYAAPGAFAGPTAPITFAASDVVNASIAYEAA